MLITKQFRSLLTSSVCTKNTMEVKGNAEERYAYRFENNRRLSFIYILGGQSLQSQHHQEKIKNTFFLMDWIVKSGIYTPKWSQTKWLWIKEINKENFGFMLTLSLCKPELCLLRNSTLVPLMLIHNHTHRNNAEGLWAILIECSVQCQSFYYVSLQCEYSISSLVLSVLPALSFPQLCTNDIQHWHKWQPPLFVLHFVNNQELFVLQLVDCIKTIYLQMFCVLYWIWELHRACSLIRLWWKLGTGG